MLFIAATFVGVVALVVGIYWVMYERPEEIEQSKLRKRLRAAVGPKEAKRIHFVQEAEKLSSVKSLNAVLARTSGITNWLQRLIAQADMKITVGVLLLASACLFLAGWIVIGWITRLHWLGLAAGAM